MGAMIAGATLGGGAVLLSEILELPPRYAVMVGMLAMFAANLLDS